jgi:hypothetical protein
MCSPSALAVVANGGGGAAWMEMERPSAVVETK